MEDLIFYAAVGIVLGGRLGYAFFYGFDRLLSDPLWLLRVWEGGMAFHGGLIGVLVAMALFARQRDIDWGRLMDFVAPLTPVGLALGRLGNFIGQELWGRAADVPWAMVFPNDPLAIARHPSQLYQFALEGCLLFVVLLWFSRGPRPAWSVSGLFLIGYGVLPLYGRILPRTGCSYWLRCAGLDDSWAVTVFANVGGRRCVTFLGLPVRQAMRMTCSLIWIY